MLSKCANPTCSARFRYLHLGRIFKIDVSGGSFAAHQRHVAKIEYFWLCEKCVETHKLVLEFGIVTAQLRRAELPAASDTVEEKKREVA